MLDLLKEKESKLKTLLPTLDRVYEAKPRTEEAFVYRGIEGAKNALHDVILLKEDLYTIGWKGLSPNSRANSFANNFIQDATLAGIKFHSLIDPCSNTSSTKFLEALPGTYRILPKQYQAHGSVYIFGDRVVTFAGAGYFDLQSEITLYVTINEAVANMYRSWFQILWEACSS